MSGVQLHRRVGRIGAAVLVCAGLVTAGWADEPEAPSALEQTAPASGLGAVVPGLEASVDLGFFNKYVWRGMLVTDDPVFEPSFTLGYKGLSLNVWGNMDLTSVNDNSGEFNEVDYTLDYTFEPIDKLSVSLGAILYDFPNTDFDATVELYAGAGLDIPLQPSIKAYLDVDEAEGWYIQASIGHSFELPELAEGVTLSLDLSASVGWASEDYNSFYFGASSAAFSDVNVGASLPIGIGEHVTITPSVAYTGILDGGLRGQVDDPDNVVFGITCSFSF